MTKMRKETYKVRSKEVIKALNKNNMNIQKAAKDLGESYQTVRNRMLRNPYIKAYLVDFYKKLDEAGATDDKAAKVISEAMDAKKEVFDKDGNIVAEREDHVVRLRSVELMAKIKRYIGDSDDVTRETNVGTQNIQIVFGDSGKNIRDLDVSSESSL